jgi:hypothetical protein
MKEKKTMIKKLGALLSASLCAALILSCSPLFEAPVEAAGGSGETGRVVLSVSAGGAGPARTVLPKTAPEFSRYELIFSMDGAEDVTVSDTAGIAGAGVSQELAAGEWTATVTAYRKFTVTGGQEKDYPAARGSSPITVAAGRVTEATVTLMPLSEAGTTEKGIFTYTVIFPAGATVTLKFGRDETVSLTTSGQNVSVDKAPGYYDLCISATRGRLSAGRAEKVHIYAGLESAAVFTFAEADFVKTVYLAGTLPLPSGVTVSGGTINAYSDAAYNSPIGTTSDPATDGSWLITIPVANIPAASVVYFEAEMTGTDGKFYTGTGNTSDAVTEEGVQGIVLADTTPPASVTGPNSGEVTLTWTDPADADLKDIEISWTPANGNSPVTAAKSSNGNQTNSKTIGGLTAGTEYTFTLKAVDTAENRSTGETVKAKPFVPVTNITGVPTSGTVGQTTLTGTVAPDNATNKAIVWSVQDLGGTGADIASGTATLITTTAGTVSVTATIANGTAVGTDYTQEFDITISSPSHSSRSHDDSCPRGNGSLRYAMGQFR